MKKMSWLDFGITDTAISVIQTLWNMAPGPIRAIIAILMAGILVFAVSEAVIKPVDRMAGGGIVEKLTIGGPGCDESLKPTCTPINFSASLGSWAAITSAEGYLNTCLIVARAANGLSSSTCDIKPVWKPATRVVSNVSLTEIYSWGFNINDYEIGNSKCRNLITRSESECVQVCNDVLTGCSQAAHPYLLAAYLPGGSENRVWFTCQETDYDEKQTAYSASCRRGVYMLDARIWTFFPLSVMFVYYFVFPWYQATIPR